MKHSEHDGHGFGVSMFAQNDREVFSRSQDVSIQLKQVKSPCIEEEKRENDGSLKQPKINNFAINNNILMKKQLTAKQQVVPKLASINDLAE